MNPDWLTFVLLMVIVVISHVLESITGFGSTALSLPFMTLLIPVYVAKPVLAIYTLLLCGYILLCNRRQIRWDAFRQMVLWLLPGLLMGMMVYAFLPQKLLLWVLTVFTIAIAVRGLGKCFGLLPAEGKPFPKTVDRLLLLLGGVMHGAFAAGGPILVIHAAKAVPDKTQFRATMCLIWLMLNSILLIQMGIAGQLTSQVLSLTVKGLPFLIISILLGDRIQKRMNGEGFSKITFAMLLLSGLAMAWTQLR